jgi:hypothetical protein
MVSVISTAKVIRASLLSNVVMRLKEPIAYRTYEFFHQQVTWKRDYAEAADSAETHSSPKNVGIIPTPKCI